MLRGADLKNYSTNDGSSVQLRRMKSRVVTVKRVREQGGPPVKLTEKGYFKPGFVNIWSIRTGVSHRNHTTEKTTHYEFQCP